MVPKLKRILSKGSSQSPVAILAEEGIDILAPEFWQRSISLIQSVCDELKALIHQPNG